VELLKVIHPRNGKTVVNHVRLCRTSTSHRQHYYYCYCCNGVQQWRPRTTTATNNNHDSHNYDGHKPWWPTWWNLSNEVKWA